VVNDAGFRHHIPAEQVDRAVLAQIAEVMKAAKTSSRSRPPKCWGRTTLSRRR
jgi:hypothetical protein